MKGVVFNILEEMVVEQGGLALWQSLLDETGLDGSYTAVETYTDDQLFALVGAVSSRLEVPPEQIVQSFGEFMFSRLAGAYPEFVAQPKGLFEFLHSIDSVIHLEVRKLLSETHLPKIVCETESDQLLVMRYSSPRKLCMLAEGLVRGAAQFYGEQVSIEHPICMHRASDHCELRVLRGE